MTKCIECGREYEYDRKKGHNKTKCNSCVVNNRRFILKHKCIQYKGGKCEICGYKKCLRALTFHHKDSTEKEFQISGKHCIAWEKIKSELDKCSLLCSNCHMEVHDTLEKISKPNLEEINNRELEKFINRTAKIKKDDEQTECRICKKLKSRKLKYCSIECAGKAGRKIDWDNIDLEKLCKEKSVLKLSKELGISDVAIHKRLKKLGLK